MDYTYCTSLHFALTDRRYDTKLHHVPPFVAPKRLDEVRYLDSDKPSTEKIKFENLPDVFEEALYRGDVDSSALIDTILKAGQERRAILSTSCPSMRPVDDAN